MFSNTDYPALILAVVALISPAFVEWLRQIYDTKKTDKENQRRADELKAENIRRDKERREEYNQRKIERQEEYEQTNHVNRNLNTLNKVPSFHFESLERIQKGYYFTKDKTELGKSGSTPLEFEDAEKQVWYMDMNLTKDEAYSILKNIAIGNKKYSKEL